MKEIIVTTSWEDGDGQNLRLVKLLNKYCLKGTFYFARDYLSQPESEIKEISLTQEIGAHSLTHPILTDVSLIKAQEEIFGSKEWLESLTGKSMKMFCYPRGFYNQEIKDLVSKAGFVGARAAGIFNGSLPEDLFAWDPTIQIYPFPFRRRSFKRLHLSRHLLDPFFRNFGGIINWHLPLKTCFNWINLAKGTFDYVCRRGGVWHLWGHCFEIEKYRMWSELEEIFCYIKEQGKALPLFNSEVFFMDLNTKSDSL